MPVNAGVLRHRVEIQTVARSDTASGGVTEVWSTALTVWASIESLSAYEQYTYGQRWPEVTHKVTMRYQPNITPNKRMKFGTRIFDIQGVTNKDQRNELLTVIVKESPAPVA